MEPLFRKGDFRNSFGDKPQTEERNSPAAAQCGTFKREHGVF